ncbi:unnamed protein product [Schistosoma rodhaini]|nr:unnamed protein product [Schistosoma rodhaini]
MYSLAPPEAKKTFTSKTALEDAVSHIIADIFAKDLDIIRKAEELCSKYIATLVTAKKSKRGKKVEQSSGGNLPNSMSIDFDENENADDAECIQNSHSSMNNTNNNSKKDDLVTFKNYLNFSRPVSSILAHQVLAINRANERGVITVKIHLSPQVQHNCATFVSQKYFPTTNRIHWDFVMSAFNDAWKRLIDPHLVRSIRTKLTTSAQDASLEVFSENLRRLLMTAPLRIPVSSNDSTVKNENDIGMISSASGAPGDRLPVIGLDPGWRNGCKWAACDPHGNVLSTGILWPPHTLSAIPPKKLSVQNGPMSNNGLGALTAVKGIGQATFAQCAGFVRVKPTYSTTTLDGTKDVEMISISSGDDNDGDDLTCDTQITNIFTGSTKRKHISNESNKKCKKRRIMDVTVTDQSDVNCFNPLDQTAVHPDSYEVAANIISLLQLNLTDVGSMKMRTAATQFMISEDRDKRLEQFCSKTVGLDTLRDILVALTRPLDFDERQDCFTPLFHSTVMKISDLRKGMQVKGRVENVTTFGAFCDIGVEENAYIPRHEYPRNCSTSNLKITSGTSTTGIGVSDGGDIHHKMFTLRLGDRIKATVSSVDIKYKRVALHKVFVMT